MVKERSVFINSDEINFIITDFKNEINVSYSGLFQIYLQKEKEWLLKVF